MSVRIANAPCSWGIYQLADGAGIPYQTVLDGIRSAGYAGTEVGPYGYYPTDHSVFVNELAARGLSIPAGSAKEPYHIESELPEILQRTRKTAALLQAVGAEFIVILCGGTTNRPATAGRSDLATRLDASQWRAFKGNVAAVARMVKEEFNVTAVLHPHAGSFIEFQDEVDRALEQLDPAFVKLCIDTGHCAYAGIDPIQLFSVHSKRTPYFHFKNVDPSILEEVKRRNIGLQDAVRMGVFCPLDRGVVNFKKLEETLRRFDFSGWATVEQDHDRASGTGDPLADARQSLTYLRLIGLAT